MKNTTKQICITAMGVALFVALTLCVQVPVFQNYYLCLGYVVMTVYCYTIGTKSGTIVGTMGVVLYCLLISGCPVFLICRFTVLVLHSILYIVVIYRR